MSRMQKEAIVRLAVAGLVLAFLTILVFACGGVRSFTGERWRISGTAVVVGLGYLMIFLLLTGAWFRGRSGSIIRDERDERIARYANGIALVGLAVYVFILSLALYEGYHDKMVVPVGWMWFMAYSSSYVGILFHAAAMLFLYTGCGCHGEE